MPRDPETLARFLARTPFFGALDDAVRQAESIRQQSLAARNKLKLVRERK